MDAAGQTASSPGQADLHPQLLEKLACPLSRAPLVEVGGWLYSTDRDTRRRYPIVDGLPVLLVEQAETVGLEEFDQIMRSQEAGRMTNQDEGN